MYKSKLGIMAALVCLATSITFAQSFFSSAPATKNTSVATAPPQAVSPEDFKNLVKQQSQQTQTQLNQQVAKTLSKDPFVPSPLPKAPVSQPLNTTTSGTPVAPPIPMPTPLPEAAVDQPQPDNSDESPVTSGESQSYTGFQAPPTKQNNSSSGNSNSQDSTNLGIKY
jgi:hypothetical protein